jgi:hypothetical protein
VATVIGMLDKWVLQCSVEVSNDASWLVVLTRREAGDAMARQSELTDEVEITDKQVEMTCL